MPFYEYRCDSCEEDFTLIRPMADRDEPAECPECKTKGAKRAVSSFATSSGGSSSDGGGSCTPGFG